MLAFWDTSALLRLCVRGQFSPRAKRILQDAGMVAWWATAVEGRNALMRLRREGSLSPAAYRVSCERLAALLSSSREVLPTEAVREIAYRQIERFSIRASDALQLAAALVWCGERPRGRWFVCDDRRLADAALDAGFELKNI